MEGFSVGRELVVWLGGGGCRKFGDVCGMMDHQWHFYDGFGIAMQENNY